MRKAQAPKRSKSGKSGEVSMESSASGRSWPRKDVGLVRALRGAVVVLEHCCSGRLLPVQGRLAPLMSLATPHKAKGTRRVLALRVHPSMSPAACQ